MHEGFGGFVDPTIADDETEFAPTAAIADFVGAASIALPLADVP